MVASIKMRILWTKRFGKGQLGLIQEKSIFKSKSTPKDFVTFTLKINWRTPLIGPYLWLFGWMWSLIRLSTHCDTPILSGTSKSFHKIWSG